MQLGVLNPVNNFCPCFGMQTLQVNSSTGGGSVTLKPGKVPCGGCCFFACCCGGSASYNVIINGEKVGSMGHDGDGGSPMVTFPPSLDPRLKGIIVVLSFMLVRLG